MLARFPRVDAAEGRDDHGIGDREVVDSGGSPLERVCGYAVCYGTRNRL